MDRLLRESRAEGTCTARATCAAESPAARTATRNPYPPLTQTRLWAPPPCRRWHCHLSRHLCPARLARYPRLTSRPWLTAIQCPPARSPGRSPGQNRAYGVARLSLGEQNLGTIRTATLHTSMVLCYALLLRAERGHPHLVAGPFMRALSKSHVPRSWHTFTAA